MVALTLLKIDTYIMFLPQVYLWMQNALTFWLRPHAAELFRKHSEIQLGSGGPPQICIHTSSELVRVCKSVGTPLHTGKVFTVNNVCSRLRDLNRCFFFNSWYFGRGWMGVRARKVLLYLVFTSGLIRWTCAAVQRYALNSYHIVS